MKRFISLLLCLLIALLLTSPANVMAQDDEVEVTLFVTEDAAYSVALLDGWAAGGNRDDGLSVANSQETLDKFDSDQDPGPGDLGIRVLALPTDTLAEFGLEEDASLVEILTAFIPLLGADSDEPVDIGEVTELDFAGRPAATVVGQSDSLVAQFVFYVLAPETIGIGFVGGHPETFEEIGELGLQILATARYSPALEETFDDGAIAFAYLTDWVADGESGLYTVTNDAEALEVDVMTEGQFGIFVFDLGLLGYTGDSVSDVAGQVSAAILDEEQHHSDPIELEVGDDTVAIIDITTPETEGSEGGIMVVQTEDGVFGVVFVTAHGQSYQLGLIALNVLLSAE